MLKDQQTYENYLTEADVVRRLQAAVGDMPLKRFAQNNGVSAPYVSDVLKGKRGPGPVICRVLGLEAVTVYREVSR